MGRCLRPGFVVPSGGRLWVVDAFQPVAAVLEPGSGAVERLVSWPQLPSPPVTNVPWWEGWQILAADPGLWVQPYPGGPVALIDTDGLVQASYVAGRRLAGVTATGAWCGPQPRNQRELVRRPPEPEEILCLPRDGDLRVVTVDRPVGRLRTAHGGVYVCVRADPTVRSDHLPHAHEPDPAQVWLHLPAEAPLPRRLSRAKHGDAPRPRARSRCCRAARHLSVRGTRPPASGGGRPLWLVGCGGR